MAFNMGDQFRGLPMGDLIGAPLMAAADAQVRLANSTAAFIQQIGFTPKPDKDGKLPTDLGNVPFKPDNFDVRTVDFKFERPAGPMDDKGHVPTETVSLEVPLLAIVKIPSLSIDTVDIIFDMEVKNSESSKESSDAAAKMAGDATIGWGPFSVSVHVEGSVASHKENTRSTDQSAKYHVELHAADKGMPEGLARVLDIMNSAIAPKTITKNESDKTADDGKTPPQQAPLGFNPDSVVLDHEIGAQAQVLRPGNYVVSAA